MKRAGSPRRWKRDGGRSMYLRPAQPPRSTPRFFRHITLSCLSSSRAFLSYANARCGPAVGRETHRGRPRERSSIFIFLFYFLIRGSIFLSNLYESSTCFLIKLNFAFVNYTDKKKFWNSISTLLALPDIQIFFFVESYFCRTN